MRKYFFLLAILAVNHNLIAQDPFNNLLKKAKDKAKQVVSESADKKRDQLDSTDFQLAFSVVDNAALFDYASAEEIAAKSVNFLLKNDEDYTTEERGRAILDTALFNYNRRWFKLAEQYLEKSKEFFESNGLSANINYTKTIATLGLLNSTTGKLAAAETYVNEVINAVSAGTAAYAATLNNRAKIYQQTGRYNEAEQDFLRAAELIKKSYGESSLQHAIVLNNVAVLYQVIGRFKQAEENLKRAIAIAEPLQREKSVEHRILQTNLALLYQQSGRLTEAEASFTAIKKIFENRGQTGTPEYGDVLTQLAVLFIQMKKNDQVEPLLKKAQDVYKRKFTENHPSYARATNIQGNFYRMTGRFNEAETLIDKARQIREATLGTNHPDYVQSSEDLALVYWKKGLDDKAFMMYREVMDKTIDFINNYFPPMSEAEKTNFWDVTSPRFQRFFNFAVSAQERGALTLQDFYEYHIATKALLLNSTSKIKNTILKSKDGKLVADYLAWLDQKETLARYYAYSKEELKNQKIDLAALERKANEMEKSLSSRSAEFSSGYSTQKISFKQVRDLLTDQEAIIEIVRIRNFDQDFTKDVRYAALIIAKGLESPRLVMLPNGSELETRYANFYKNAVQKRIEDEYSYDQYWARIEPALAGKKTIYVSPDGVFNQINLNSLKKTGGDFVLNRYDLIVLGNSKDLLALKNKKQSAAKRNAVLVGFPEYGTSQVASLPGTKVELEGVSKVLKASGYTVSQLMQKEASEKNVKNIKAPAVVHIATHGYFQADVDGRAAFGVNLETAGNNPLLRSGLILANAGAALSGTQTPDLNSNDNGILTAYEAMNLDLQGTGLVILSACETGLGEVKSGEGVYGLQRAFLVAGAESLIMSLWKVDDAATQQLMTNFYSNWIKTGNRQKAFKQAQLQLMTKYKDPFYWGAFVMMGM